MSRKTGPLLFWPPRILTIAFAIFLGVFALDVFNEPHGFWRTVLAFGIHLIPAAMVVAILAAAWRWEWPGVLFFTLAAALYAWHVLPVHPGWAAAIAIPMLVIAGLFFADWLAQPRPRMTH